MKNITIVFWGAITICLILVFWGAFAPENLEAVSAGAKSFISDTFGWYYMLIIMSMIVFSIYLIFSPIGNIKLGKEKDEPEFNLLTWFAMLFSAGMGIGLVFFTTAEPISHAFISAPSMELGTDQAIQESLQYAAFHWGINGWALYANVALVLAYFNFRHDKPSLISSTLEPLLGEKVIRGMTGKVIDMLAIFATIVGVASTLGFGSSQIRAGLAYLFSTPETFGFQLLIIAVVTVLFIISAWSGIGRGIKYLSNLSMGLAVLLALLLFIVGPTIYILNMFTTMIGNYTANFLEMSFQLKPSDQAGRAWINNWTIFYWAWWISWAPFVGMFIARVSKGRTIKQFVLGVLLAPTLVTFIFFSVLGSSAIHLEQNGIAIISEFSTETATFGMLENYSLGSFMSMITLIIVAIFFITSADSATFVLGMLSMDGSLNPANIVKIIWGLTLAAMASIVVYFGGIQGFENLLIVVALPFSFVIILMIISFVKKVMQEKSIS